MTNNIDLDTFNPNSPGNPDANIYGLPFDTNSANLVIIPVPWDVTVSYTKGTAKGPKAVFDASFQVDLCDSIVKDAWKLGIAMDEIDMKIWKKSKMMRKDAESYINVFIEGKDPEEHKSMKKILSNINKSSEWLNKQVRKKALHFLNKRKAVALLGGDHSTPLGLMMALSEVYPEFGILQIDAHADLRQSYEGFIYSHASIMYNAVKIPSVHKLVQVGIRDYCEEEKLFIETNEKIVTFFDKDIKHQQYKGKTWEKICKEIVNCLPQNVYISFDIDGLDPRYCPNTGTPVPGGFEFEQVLFLFEMVIASGRKIISFDLNEVSPGKGDEWDANVGARMLYRLSNILLSQAQ
jgi:agmatinase